MSSVHRGGKGAGGEWTGLQRAPREKVPLILRPVLVDESAFHLKSATLDYNVVEENNHGAHSVIPFYANVCQEILFSDGKQ